MKHYLYLITRKDLGPAYSIIQTAHAAWELGLKTDPFSQTPTFFCLLEAKDEHELLKISHELQERGLKHECFYEPDNNTGYTSIACGPFEETAPERKYFRKFKMYR